MATSASGTSGTGDAEDLINGPPLQFRPADEPEFIKRHRTTLLMVHTKVGSRIRRAISNSINPEDIKDDLAKLAVTYERAIQTNDTLSAAINLRDPASTSITKAERWKEDLQEEHQRLQDEVAAFIARMTHPAAANTSAADPVSTEAPSNTSQPMQTLSVPTSLQPSTSTLSHPGSPFRSAVNTNSTVTMRSPPSLSVTSAINSPRLALRPSLNPALNFNQQSSTVIRAANQPPSITHWIAQQQVAHQPLNQPSSFVQQLTAAAAGVMQQTPNQLPSVSQHQPPPPGIGQQQVAHQLLNHLSASVQQGASVNVMQQTPTQPLSVSQNPPPPSAAAVQQGASSFVIQQAPSQPPSVSQHQPPHSTMGQQQVAQQPLNLSVSSVLQGGSASVMQQVHNQLPSVSQNQPSSFGCLQQQLANQLLNQPAASGQQVSPAIMMQQSLNQVLSVAQHQPLPTSLAQQQGTFQPNTSSAPHGQQSVANVLMQPAPPVLNVAQYQPPSIGTAYPQVAHQLLNHSAASGYPAASSSSMQQPLNQVPNAAQYQPTSSGITQQQVTYQLPTSSAVHSQQSAVNVLLQQAQHQVSNAAQYQPTSSGSAQQQVTYQPFTSSAALVQQSAGNGLMQQAPHQVLNAAQYQPTFSGMSYSQSVHQPFSVAGPGHQMASGVTHQGPSVHLPVSSAAYAPPSWQSMQQLGSYQPPVTASVAGQQQCTVPQWPTSTATLQSSMYIPSGTVHQPGSIISSLYPATMYQQMAPIQAAPSSTGHQTIAHGLIHQPPYSHQTGAYQLPGSIPTSYHGQHPAASYFPPPCTSSSQSVNGAGLNISYLAQMIPQAGQQGWMPPIDQSARWGSSTARFSNIRVEPFDGDPLKWPMFISNFKTLIADELPTDALRLAALREHLTPSVRNVVADALHHPEMFNLAMHRLSEEFGESFVVSEAQVDKLLGLPTVKQNDQLSLKKFSSELHGAVAALVHSGNNVELSSSGTLKMLLMKLPQGLRTKWGTKVYEMLPRTPNIVDLDVWLRKMVKGYEYAAAALGSQPPPPPPPPPAAAHKLKKKTYTPTINAISDGATAGGENLEEEATGPETRRSSSEKGYACFCCKISSPHKIESCSTFLALTPTKRAELVRKENRCLRCVIGKHFSRRCPSRITCSVEGCDQRHHQLLHGAERVNPKPSATVEQQSSASGSINAVREEESVPGYVHRQIVSVVIRAPNGKKTSTLGFLDNGSSCVLIQQDLADELGLPGPTAERSFRLFNGEKVQVPSRLVDFMLCSKDGTTSFRVSMGYTTPKVEVAERITHWPEVKNRYPQLMDLDLPDVDPRNVKVLIGNNIFGAHVQLEVRYPDERAGGPGAIRTPFGWCVSGPVLSASVHHAESPYVNHIGLGDLMESVERFWITDSAGTNPPESLVLSKSNRNNGVGNAAGGWSPPNGSLMEGRKTSS